MDLLGMDCWRLAVHSRYLRMDFGLDMKKQYKMHMNK